MMNKKGAELSMNVIIVAILVLLVLVILAYFFLGGTAKLFRGITQIAPSKADIMSVAISDCQGKCQIAQNYDSDLQKQNSGYCKKQILVDTNGDDIADEIHRCYSNNVGVECPGVGEDICGYDDVVVLEK